MDFLSLAHVAHEASHTFIRILTAEAVDENDDFTQLENIGARGSPHSTAVVENPVMVAFSTSDFTNNDSALENKPLLSPTAEAALLELSMNFLLYAAMVIITAMVAKIYFPSLLVPREEPNIFHSYVRVLGQEYRSDISDEEDGDEEESEIVDDKHKATNGLLINTTEGNGNMGVGTKHLLKNGMNMFAVSQDQRLGSIESVYSNLAFCAIMLNVTFVIWGALQERMLTRKYPRHTGEYFTYSYALVFTNRFWTFVISGLLMLYFKPRASRTTVIYEYSFPAISNMLSSWCQYEALRYVSFPAVTLFKAFKLAPVMLMGKFLGDQSYPQYDYIVAIFIGIGIAMFMTSTDELSFDLDAFGEHSSAKWTGVMLLLFFLFFDSFTSQWQSRMFKTHRDLSMIELMFATSAFSTVLSFITLVHDGKLWPAFEFVVRHSEIQFHFFVFSVCSTIGQLFIYYTIKNFGALVFAIIMTTRVLLSIALSVILYKHRVTSTGFFGLVLVTGAVCYRIKRKAEGRQLIKWQGMGHKCGKEIELVQEWHEHVDT